MLICFSALLIAPLAARAAVVSPANMQGWVCFDDNGAGNGSCTLVDGPGAPPLGLGSARFTLNSATAGWAIGNVAYAGVRFDQITALSYSTYRTSSDAGNNLAVALQLELDCDLNDATTSYQGRLNFEPYITAGSGNVLSGVWQSWNPLDPGAKWWTSRSTLVKANASIPTPCDHDHPCTMATFLATCPNAGIRNAGPGTGAVVFKAGSNWSGFDGNMDAFTLTTALPSGATYDFEACVSVADCDDGNPCTIDSCTSGVCANAPGNVGAVCRAQAGACDLQEVCDGSHAACPADAKSTAQCRAAAGACDVAETCDGVSNTCPADILTASGTECRAVAGECDLAETCTGSSPTCPADAKKASGSACTDEGAECTRNVCDGVSDACSHPNEQDNLVSNPGFQTGTLAPWTLNTVTGFAQVLDFNTGHLGSTHSFNTTASSHVFLSEFLTTTPGESYALTAWVSTSTAPVTMTIYWGGSIVGTNVLPAASPYTQFRIAHLPTILSSTELKFEITTTGDSALLDDVQISAECNNGSFCDGENTCSAGACTITTGINPCAGGGECDNQCNETGGGAGNCYVTAGTACGSSSDTVCDNPDTCSGTGSCLPNHEPPTTVCRASAGQCDVAEQCDGAGACPADVFESNTTNCVGASQGGACDNDVADHCSGTSNACVDVYQANTYVCRADAGQCDVAENCTGSSGACPGDSFEPASTSCSGASQGGACDDDSADHCTGTDNVCVDVFKSAATVCRGSAGICDVAENCSGASGACPADAFVASSTVCRASAGTCDVVENCTGSSATCPADAFLPSSTICRASAGICDIAENCTGSGAACPADLLQSAAVECRASTGDCDPAELCTGAGVTCPADAKSNSICRPVGSEFFQGFEVDTNLWLPLGGSLTRVASGTHGITSRSGGQHAEVGAVSISNGGPFTRWGGYNSTFPSGGYTTSVDVYLDVSGGAANDTRFDFSSAINNPSGSHRQDFIYSVGFYNDSDVTGSGPRFVISASNNSPGWPKDPGRSPFAITASGWYRLQHHFYDAGGGVLAVDLNLRDAADVLLHTWTLSNPTNIIGTTVGGNRYGWFVYSQFPFLAIDDSQRTVVAVCDVAESCDGVADSCPADGFLPSTTECRGSAGVCDTAENCTGSSRDCPGDSKSTAECRASAGVCDVAESCDGVNNDCPTNGFQPSSLLCRAGSGDVCDPNENCTGSSAACPSDAVAPTTTVCRISAGVCDLAENCTGVAGQACPADAKSSALCRGVADVCDVAENCDGVNNDCPMDTFQPSGTVCRSSAGQCDVAEACTGTSSACPADAFEPNTTNCTGSSQGGACDDQDKCSGTANTCVDQFKSASTVCRASTGQCDVAENCTGTSGACPTDGFKVSGTACNDGLFCTVGDVCDGANTCGGTARDCNSGPSGVVSVGFEPATYAPGNINGQDGWSKTGAFDVAVVSNTYGYSTFGTQSLRISDAVTSGSFGDQTFSKPLTNEVGETTALNGGASGGTRKTHFEAEWDLASTVPGSEQTGLHFSASADRGDGARMTYLRFEDSSTGLQVYFDDFQDDPSNGYGAPGSESNGCTSMCVGGISPAPGAPCNNDSDCDQANGGSCTGGDGFFETQVGTDLDRAVPHHIKLTLDTLDGPHNDVVDVYIDGTLVHSATSWEDYYRWCAESNQGFTNHDSRTVDSMLFRVSGDNNPGNAGNGFLIDNLRLQSGIGDECNVAVCSEGTDTCDPAPTNEAGACGDQDNTDCNAPNTCVSGVCVDNKKPNTYVCRADAGQCDVEETCTGTSNTCPANAYEPNTTSCTGAANGDLCDDDAADHCSGTANTCVDAFQTNAYVCRAAAGQCDVAETCTGTGSACPADIFVPNTVVCRAGSGDICDPDENCTGSSAACPSDVVAPTTTGCRSSAGICDVAENCTGVPGQACPIDAFEPNTTTCRPAVPGGCDIAESCTGSSAACPTDSVEANGTVCRAAVPGGCDVTETCNGSSNACPTDTFQPSTTVCRPAVNGGCDVGEKCTGVSNACPADAVQPAGTVCRPTNGACDVAESCDGSSNACPSDGYASSSTVCRPAIPGGCDTAENCSGSSATCPADTIEPNTTVCRSATGVCDVAENCTGSGASTVIYDSIPSPRPGNVVSEGFEATSLREFGDDILFASTERFVTDVTVTMSAWGKHSEYPALDPSNTGYWSHPITLNIYAVDNSGPNPAVGALLHSVTQTFSIPWRPEPDPTCPGGTAWRLDATHCYNGFAFDITFNVGFQLTGNEALFTIVYNTADYGPAPIHAPGPYNSLNVGLRDRNVFGAVPVGTDNEVVALFANSSWPGFYTNPACTGGTLCRDTGWTRYTPAIRVEAVNLDCPADLVKPNTTVCRAAVSGGCDLTENCDGSGKNCPADAVEPNGTVCRASAGICDVTETCDGSSNTCPSDSFLPNSTVCRGSAGVCDVAENCTGSSAACPTDSFLPNSTVCRGSAGVCDVAENCTGSSAACPTDVFLPNSTLCRSAAGICDAVENCTGAAAGCPSDAKLPSSSVCRTAASDCDIAENCTGSSDTCPADALRPNGFLCNADSNGCTFNDSCLSGTCQVGTTVNCNNGVSCAIPSCNSTGNNTHSCSYAPNNAVCNDGVACTADSCNVNVGCAHVAGCSACPNSTVTNDPGTGPTASQPVTTSVTCPSGVGTVTIEDGNRTYSLPGYTPFDQQSNVLAPATTVTSPLIVTLGIDVSIIPPGADPFDVQVFKDGLLVPPCTGPTGQAVPDPCVSSKVLQPSGDLKLILLTADAAFDFGTPICGDGTVEMGEDCDDSNVVSGDGCSSTCATEVCPTCPSVNLLNSTTVKPVGRPGGLACVFASLTANGNMVAATSNDIGLSSSPMSTGTCTINSTIAASPYSKQLDHGPVAPHTERVAIFGFNQQTLPDGALYTCALSVPPTASLGSYQISNTNVGVSDPLGFDIPGAGGNPAQVVLTTCSGDCNGDNTVSAGEVLKVVKLHLGDPLCNDSIPSKSCPVSDTNNNGVVSIGEVQQAVNLFLGGCP